MPDKRTSLVISVVGTSGSGKTTTIEYLTSALTKLDFKVGVAKHIHREGFTIDTEGKDTWRHARAGANVVVGVSPNELAVIKKTSSETKMGDVTRILRNQRLDLALLEGFSTALAARKLFRLITAKNASDLNYTLKKTPKPILAITGPVARTLSHSKNHSALLVDLPNEGPILTTMIRRLLHPKEIKHLLKNAALRHGGRCVGLAIGIRAAYLASTAFASHSRPPKTVICGTKHCIAEAFSTVFPKSDVRIDRTRNDRITVNSTQLKLTIQLAPKRKFAAAREVLALPDKELFTSVAFTRQ